MKRQTKQPVTAIGLETDPTMSHFLERAGKLGAEIRFIDLNRQVDEPWQFLLPPDHPSTGSRIGGPFGELDPEGSFYCRLIDLAPVSPHKSQAWRSLIGALMSWLELHPGRVVNRPGHAVDNACKPLHEALLAGMGFSVPPSFCGSRRASLLEFLDGGPAVAKPLCGQRADCRIVTRNDLDDYDDRSGPVNLQRFIPGDDVRAHVIGDEVLALRIRSGEEDYRLDGDADFKPWTLPAGFSQALCAATRRMGLAFAGWDLRIDGDAHWVFEANPMPGYHYYDRKLDGRITEALIRYMSGPA